MTKPRAPLTIDAALTRIAGQFQNGFTDLKPFVDRDPETIRKWGDPAQPHQLPMWAAIKLDIAFQQAGGEGAPIFECYELLLQVARQETFADELQLQRGACDLVVQSAEAVEAIVIAGMPGATQAQKDRAAAELEDVDQLVPRLLARLKPNPSTGPP